MHYSDRSRSVKYEGCPRSFWYEYGIPNGTPVMGIVPDKLNMDLTLGLTFHEGSNHLLEGVGVDEAVGRALEGHGKWRGYWPSVKSAGFVLDPNEDASYVAHEQAALSEALIRGYAIFGISQLLQRFTVVEAERDEYGIFTQGDFSMIWGMRGDALLMDKNTLDLYILSLKTKKEWKGIRDEKKAGRYDMQGLSETAVVEQRLKRWDKILHEAATTEICKTSGIPQWFFDRWEAGASPDIMGVKMDFALKGYRAESPKGSRVWKYFNSLIRPWKKDDGFGGGEYAFRYNFQDAMGGNHRLGKGWNSINIWEDIGVKEWIGKLANEVIQGTEPMTGIAENFVFPGEFYRNEDDILDWQESRLFEERRIAKGLEICRPLIGKPGLEQALREHFPKYSNYPTDCTYCAYEELCHGGVKAYLHDPMSSGGFKPRENNHQAELIQISA